MNRRRLEERLGRPLEKATEASIRDLNAVPRDLIEEARTLGDPMLARALLAHYLPSSDRPHLMLFVQDVVFGGEPPERWLRGRVLAPDWSLTDQLLRSRDALLEPIGGTAMCRVRPRIESWTAGSSVVGAPARPDDSATYRTQTVPSTISLQLTVPVEPILRLDVAVRRWIAARLARVLRDDAHAFDDTVALDAALARHALPARDTWSDDARAAAAALLVDKPSDTPAGEVPGMTGADGLYAR